MNFSTSLDAHGEHFRRLARAAVMFAITLALQGCLTQLALEDENVLMEFDEPVRVEIGPDQSARLLLEGNIPNAAERINSRHSVFIHGKRLEAMIREAPDPRHIAWSANTRYGWPPPDPAAHVYERGQPIPIIVDGETVLIAFAPQTAHAGIPRPHRGWWIALGVLGDIPLLAVGVPAATVAGLVGLAVMIPLMPFYVAYEIMSNPGASLNPKGRLVSKAQPTLNSLSEPPPPPDSSPTAAKADTELSVEQASPAAAPGASAPEFWGTK